MHSRTIVQAAVLAGGLSLLAACSSSDRSGFGSGDGNDPGSGGGQIGTDSNPATPSSDECQKMDILFVVDNSGSMAEEQGNLSANFPMFLKKINAFKTKGGAALDWRIAVTTTGKTVTYTIQPPIAIPGFPGLPPQTEKGEDGKFRTGEACGEGGKRWVERADPDADVLFPCMAAAGTGGSSLEMPLLAAEMALKDRVADGTNAGFLRPDALLAIVVLSDEDDCSRKDDNFSIMNDTCATMENLVPVSEFKTSFDGIAGGAGRWATAVIAGETQCTSSFGSAVEAKRLKEFVGAAGDKGHFSSICQGNLSGALEKALDTFDAACKALPPAVK